MKKTKSLVVRMNEEEHSLLKQKAEECGISMSELIRENISSVVGEDKKIGDSYSEGTFINKNQKEFIEELSTAVEQAVSRAVAQKNNVSENITSTSIEIKDKYSEEEKEIIRGINRAINKEATFVDVKSKDWKDNAKEFQKIAERLAD